MNKRLYKGGGLVQPQNPSERSRMALTKDKLIVKIQNQAGITKSESSQHVERLLEIIKSTLANGDRVLISGFGKFSVRQEHERRGMHIQTKEKIMLRARKVLVFKASGVLREKLNEE
jgi:integration host factor subunit alpha